MQGTTLQRAALVSFVLVAVVVALRLYSDPGHWGPHQAAVRQVMDAARQGDTAAVRTLTAGEAPRRWVLEAADQQAALVAAWAGALRTVAGQRQGDTVTVLLRAQVPACPASSHLTVRLLDLPDAPPAILSLDSPCVPGGGHPDPQALGPLPY